MDDETTDKPAEASRDYDPPKGDPGPCAPPGPGMPPRPKSPEEAQREAADDLATVVVGALPELRALLAETPKRCHADAARVLNGLNDTAMTYLLARSRLP